MIKNTILIIQNLNQKKIILLFCFTITLFSISGSFQHLEILFLETKISISQLINFFRVFFNLTCFLILIIMCFKYIEIKKFNFFFLFFLIYFFLQVPGLIYTQDSYENLLLIISGLNIIFILILAIKEFNSNELRIFFYILLIFMLIVLITSYYKDFQAYFSDNYRFYGRINNYFDSIQIRSSGVSRISLIILIFYSLIIIEDINNRWLKYLPIIILVSSILLYQSRAVILLLYFFIMFNIFYVKKPIFHSILIYLLIPKLIFFVVPSINALKIYSMSQDNETNKLEMKIENNVYKYFKTEANKFYRNNEKQNFSSGRVDDWLKIYNSFNFKQNLFLGYGSQGDRYLINQTASNGPIYAFVSAGLIGFLTYTFVSLYSFILVCKYFFTNTKKEKFIDFCSIVILFILARSLIESSYAHFGIDYILMIISTCFLIKNNRIQKYD